MAVKIDKKITGYALVNEQDKLDAAVKPQNLNQKSCKLASH